MHKCPHGRNSLVGDDPGHCAAGTGSDATSGNLGSRMPKASGSQGWCSSSSQVTAGPGQRWGCMIFPVKRRTCARVAISLPIAGKVLVFAQYCRDIMDNWDEIRTAYNVARIGTVSGAAQDMGVHHATVIRHIDALEARLGVKLFQRHARGYTPTEAGDDLLRVAQATDDQLSQLEGRLRGRGDAVTGDLMITSIVELSDFLVPVLADFKAEYPDVVLRYLTDARVFRLEYGEAHVAIRAGTAPDEPDNVVQPLTKLKIGLYASKRYIEKHGMPEDESDLADHDFVGSDNPDGRAPFQQWLRARVPYDRVVFRATDTSSMISAVRSGAGIGFMPVTYGSSDPGLVEVMPPKDEWSAQLWLVTHVDLHRTAKVQALLSHLKAAVKAKEAMAT